MNNPEKTVITRREMAVGIISGVISGAVVAAAMSFLSLGMELVGLKPRGMLPLRLVDPISVRIEPANTYYINGLTDTDYLAYYRVYLMNVDLESDDRFQFVITPSDKNTSVTKVLPNDLALAKNEHGQSVQKWSGRVRMGDDVSLSMKLPPKGYEYDCVIAVRHETRFPQRDDFKVGVIYKTGVYGAEW